MSGAKKTPPLRGWVQKKKDAKKSNFVVGGAVWIGAKKEQEVIGTGVDIVSGRGGKIYKILEKELINRKSSKINESTSTLLPEGWVGKK